MSIVGEAFSKAVIGFSGLVDAISKLEEELAATKALVESLDSRIQELSDRDGIELEDLIDERIDSALSGREIEINMTGTATL
jgi:hypothetical protein